MAKTNFTKYVISDLQKRFECIGFKKRKMGLLCLPVSNDVIGWLGFNKASYRGGGVQVLEINPVVGIRNQSVERLLAEILDEPFDDVSPPTLAGNVGYMSPEDTFVTFSFEKAGEIEEVAHRLFIYVRDFGLPFIEQCSGLGALVAAMQNVRFGMPQQSEFRIPTGMFLLGDHRQADSYLTMKLEKIGDRNDLAAFRFIRFATNLRKRLVL